MHLPRTPLYLTYFLAISAFGLAVLSFSLYQEFTAPHSYQWLILASLTILSGSFTVKIPGVNSKISVADIFVFTNLILFGTYAGTITAALDGFMGSIHFEKSRKLEYTLFNIGAMALSAFAAGEVFFRMLGRGPLYLGDPVNLKEILLPTGVLALVHYIANSGSVAIIVALEHRQNIYRIWKESFLWTSITYFTGASVAALIAYRVSAITPVVLGVIVPVLLVIYFTYKTYLDKVEEHTIHLQDLNELYIRTVESLALAVDAKDQTTYGHIRRVRAYAMGMAKLCGITDTNELRAIETGSLLHDIGKLAIDDYILNKPGRLNKQEFEKMKRHAAAGDEILQQIQFPFPVAKYVRAHHERWDGTGYPDGLKGEAIPLGARILSIVDAFDAIRSVRPYKTSMPVQAALELLKAQAGTSYDPALVEFFFKNVDRLTANAEEAAKNAPELSFRIRNESASPTSPPDSLALNSALPTNVSGELVSLFEFCSSIGRHFTLSDIIVNLERRLRRLVPATTCIFYLDNGDDTLKAAYVTGKFSNLLQDRIMLLGQGISGWVAAYKRPIVNTPPALDFHSLDADFTSLTDSLVVPIVVEGRCLGTISLYVEAPRSYSQSHLSLMQIVAHHASPLLAEACGRTESSSESLLDPVTRAYRASYLPVAASQMIAASVRLQASFSLIYLKLENLPQIIHLYSLNIAESILRHVAEILSGELRTTDVLVRFGQDSFVILLAGAHPDRVLRDVQRLQHHVRSVPGFDVGGQKIFVTCSAGSASYPEDGATIFDLLVSASHCCAENSKGEDARGNVVDFLPQS